MLTAHGTQQLNDLKEKCQKNRELLGKISRKLVGENLIESYLCITELYFIHNKISNLIEDFTSDENVNILQKKMDLLEQNIGLLCLK